MKYLKYLFGIMFTGLIVILPFAANAKETSKTVLVLLDLSGSTKGDLRQEYLNHFEKKILPSMKLGDHLSVDRILEQSLSRSTMPVDIEFPASSIFDNKLKLEKKAKDARQDALKKVKELLESEGTKQTDILSSLDIAKKVFDNYPKEKKILVIMSDMIEETQHLNLRTNPHNARQTEAFIARQKAENRLPDLSGVTVYVVGATARSQELYYKIQSFWMRYFEACGASLKEKNYGRSLLKFEE